MIRLMPQGASQAPPTPPQGDPAGGPPPELLAALAASQGDAPPDDASSPDGSSPGAGGRKPKYSIEKVSQEAARYMDPGSTCGTCEFFDGKGGCHIVQGQIDPAAWCSLFTPQGADDQAQPDGDVDDDGSDSSGQPPSPNEGAPDAEGNE